MNQEIGSHKSTKVVLLSSDDQAVRKGLLEANSI